MFEIKGWVRFALYRREKYLYCRNERYLCYANAGPNLVTTKGKENVAEIVRANSGTPASPSHIGFGDGGGATAEAQTALLGVETLARAATGAGTRVGAIVTWDVLAVTNSTGGDVTVNEMGIFNAAAAGDMYARFLTQGFTMNDGDSIDVTWVLEFG